MKNFFYILLALPLFALAQSTNQNYVKTVSYKQEQNNVLPNPTATQAQVNVTYMDGLGRPIQQIAVGQSGSGQNIVTPIIYDDYGRLVKDYLPIPMGGSSMSYTDNNTIISDPTSYYTNSYNSDGGFRYAEKKFEASPLNRVLEQGAPGEAWQMGNNHTVKMEYQTNGVSDVKLYTAVATYNATSQLYDVVLTSGATSNYEQRTLYKSIVKDENWTSGSLNTTEEFKNQQGQVVLKRNYNTDGNGVAIKYNTFYVYDQFGNLSFVIPPKVDGIIDSSVLNGLCYQYKYDFRNRLVEKKLPGKDWEFIVYDKLDRVVATGPVLAPFEDLINSGKKGWIISKYDAFNRVILTAWVDISTRVYLQGLYNGLSVFNETKTTTTTTINQVGFQYSNNVGLKAGYHVLTVNYYDDYSFSGGPAISDYNTQIDGQNLVYYNNGIKPKGLPTGSWVRVLENSTNTKAETSFTLYDKKGRPVRQYSKNYLDGFASTDTKLDFTGKPLSIITKHKKEASSTTELEIRENFTYSDQDRLLTHTHKIGSGTTQLLTNNNYDELGQLIKKDVGGIDISGAASLQKVDYSYNIRGWLKSINDINELTPSTDPTDLFAFKIDYNHIENDFGNEVKALYNGNISQTYWKTDSDNVKRSYGYKYDNLNRLLKALYQRGTEVTHSYDEILNYDKNGNITDLKRNGYMDSASYGTVYPIDDLIYGYANNSNKLLSVHDESQSIDGFKDGNLSATDYTYDNFGNMNRDLNKGIQNITYNHLNLPLKIDFGTQGKISYLYNAMGAKLAKTVNNTTAQQGTVINTTDYLAGFQYKDNELQFFPTAEGYVSVTNGDKFNYVYNYTDHLGNIRVSYSVDPSDNELRIMEESHYYPFGLKHSNYNNDRVEFKKDDYGSIFAVLRPVDRNKYQYKYNGKEFQDELGLNYYDYGARNYDPAIGRWMNVDPLAENHYENNVYMYANNNPIIYIDPDGMDFTLTGQAAQDFVSSLQRELNAADRNGSGVSIDANGGGDGDPPKIGTRTIKKLKTAEEKIEEGGGESTIVGIPFDVTPIGGGGALEYISGGAAIKAGGFLLKLIRVQKLAKTAKAGSQFLKFGGDEAVIHFGKHGKSVMDALGKSSYNLKNYLTDANSIIKNGTYVPELNGYVRLIGGQGSAKFGFVGLDRATGNITTFHIKTAKELAKKAPHMFGY